MEIVIKCDCGKAMHLTEDGREDYTQRVRKGQYPENHMEFVCPCGIAIDVDWTKTDLYVIAPVGVAYSWRVEHNGKTT